MPARARPKSWWTGDPGGSSGRGRVIKTSSAASRREEQAMSRPRGSMVALVTPFRDGAVDETALRALARWQIEKGTDALVPCGTTGEGATLSDREHFRGVRACVEESRGRVPVIAGCGSNDTRKAIEKVQRAKEAGADAALVVTPYYN